MPLRYTYDPGEKLLVTHCCGRITMHDLLDHFRKVEADHRIGPDYVELVTFDDEVEILFTARDAQQIPSVYKGLKERKKIRATVFAGETPLSFGVGRMMESLHEVYNPEDTVCVVHSQEEARRWIAALPGKKE